MAKVKEEIIFDKKNPKNSKPSNEQKVGMAGGIAGFFRTAVDQLTGSGDYELQPWEKPGETSVDKVKDQLMGSGQFARNTTELELESLKSEIEALRKSGN